MKIKQSKSTTFEHENTSQLVTSQQCVKKNINF